MISKYFMISPAESWCWWCDHAPIVPMLETKARYLLQLVIQPSLSYLVLANIYDHSQVEIVKCLKWVRKQWFRSTGLAMKMMRIFLFFVSDQKECVKIQKSSKTGLCPEARSIRQQQRGYIYIFYILYITSTCGTSLQQLW